VGVTATQVAAGVEVPASIGPNAILQLVEALQASVGRDRARTVFEEAGQARYLVEPPSVMVAEGDVTALYTSLPSQLGTRLAAEVAGHAGWLTGEYLLAHRIPRPVQQVLRLLPAPLASRVLLSAIRRHAWTFVGSGRFLVAPVASVATSGDIAGRGTSRVADIDRRVRLWLRVEDCPICRGSRQSAPGCSFYAATFECLFAVLVQRRARVRETQCQAQGAAACVFEVSW
jgi:divinyl protochlorophyllide a 8-vinyl-reductase